MTGDALRLFLSYLMRGSLVKRYHNITILREDTDGRHSFGVAWMCWLLSDREPSARLLMAALDHDLPEAVTSDPSSALKWLVPELRPLIDKADDRVREVFGTAPLWLGLTEDELFVLSLADRLEAILFCWHDIKALGNYNLRTVMHRYQGWVTQQIADHPGPIADRAKEILLRISELYLHPTLEEDRVHEHE